MHPPSLVVCIFASFGSVVGYVLFTLLLHQTFQEGNVKSMQPHFARPCDTIWHAQVTMSNIAKRSGLLWVHFVGVWAASLWTFWVRMGHPLMCLPGSKCLHPLGTALSTVPALVVNIFLCTYHLSFSPASQICLAGELLKCSPC